MTFWLIVFVVVFALAPLFWFRPQFSQFYLGEDGERVRKEILQLIPKGTPATKAVVLLQKYGFRVQKIVGGNFNELQSIDFLHGDREKKSGKGIVLRIQIALVLATVQGEEKVKDHLVSVGRVGT